MLDRNQIRANLIGACKTGDIKAVQELVDSGYEADTDANNSHREILELLETHVVAQGSLVQLSDDPTKEDHSCVIITNLNVLPPTLKQRQNARGSEALMQEVFSGVIRTNNPKHAKFTAQTDNQKINIERPSHFTLLEFLKLCGIFLLFGVLLLAVGSLIGGLAGAWPDINAFFEAIHLMTAWGIGVVAVSGFLACCFTVGIYLKNYRDSVQEEMYQVVNDNIRETMSTLSTSLASLPDHIFANDINGESLLKELDKELGAPSAELFPAAIDINLDEKFNPDKKSFCCIL